MADHLSDSGVTKFFYSLTPDLILDSVEATGVRCTGRVLQLNSMENRVYEVEIEVPDSESMKSRYDAFRVVKFYRPGRWTEEQILEEHRFLLDLKSNDISVVAPLVFEDSQATVRTDPKSGLYFAVFPRAGGRSLDELNDESLGRMGRLVARMHGVGAGRKHQHRIALTTKTYGGLDEAFLMQRGFLPAEISSRYGNVVSEIFRLTDELMKGVPTIRIHGDLHLGNLLWDKKDCLVVDFDDSMTGPAIQDLWLLVPGRDEEDKRRWQVLLTGYEQLRNIDRSEMRLIEALRALRIIHFNGWIAKRWEDPAFKRVFDSFGTMQYWREQLVALEEQLYYLQNGIVPQW